MTSQKVRSIHRVLAVLPKGEISKVEVSRFKGTTPVLLASSSMTTGIRAAQATARMCVALPNHAPFDPDFAEPLLREQLLFE